MAKPPPPALARAHEPTIGREVLVWLAAHAPFERDRMCESLLGLESAPAPAALAVPPRAAAADTEAEDDPWARSRRTAAASLADDNIGYYPSGVAPLMRAVLEVPIQATDIVVDLGSGLGKAAFMLHLGSGARVHGIELERELAERATESAIRLGLDEVTFEHGDARSAALHDGTVFYLYLPFTGETLDTVMERLHAIAGRHAIVVVTLGLDLRRYTWLTARSTDDFWLSIYDSVCAGAEPRRAGSSTRDSGALRLALGAIAGDW